MTTNRKSVDDLDSLFNKAVETMDKTLDGRQKVDAEGTVYTELPSASDISNVLKFLKDQRIEALPSKNKALAKLADRFASAPFKPNDGDEPDVGISVLQ